MGRAGVSASAPVRWVRASCQLAPGFRASCGAAAGSAAPAHQHARAAGRVCQPQATRTLPPGPPSGPQILRQYLSIADAAASNGYSARECVRGMRSQKGAVMAMVNQTGEQHWKALQVGG